MNSYRLSRSTKPPVTPGPLTPRPVKIELYRKIWSRGTFAPKPAATILQEVIDACRMAGADYIDVLTTALAAKSEDAVQDATLGEM